jgi:hypothetical protein
MKEKRIANLVLTISGETEQDMIVVLMMKTDLDIPHRKKPAASTVRVVASSVSSQRVGAV